MVGIFKIHNTKTSFHDARNIFGAASYSLVILGNPGAISRDDTMFVVKAYYAMAMGAVDLVKISRISGSAVN